MFALFPTLFLSLQVMIHPFLNNTDEICWEQLTSDRLVADISLAIEQSKERINQIATLDLDAVNFQNTVEALEEATEVLEAAWTKANHLSMVNNSDAFRAAYNEILGSVTNFFHSIVLNDALWERLKRFDQENPKLNPVQQRLWDETRRDFEEGGANLKPEKKQELLAIQKELAEKTQKFSENTLDALNSWEKYVSDKNQLKGMPENILELMQQDAKQHHQEGHYRLTLQAPILNPAMSFLENEELRKELWKASIELCRQGKFSNATLVQEILQLRQREAKILGFANFPDYVLSRRMAKNGQKALRFIIDLHDRIEPFFQKEVKALVEFKKSQGNDTPLQPWETAYWSEKMCQELYHFSDEEIRPYLPLDTILNGLFDLLQQLYGIEIRERETTTTGKENCVSVWHPSVRFFNVFDSNRLLGSFYLDLFPRKEKRSGAWQETLRPGKRLKNGQYQTPIGIVAGNMTPPSEEKPSLLTHRELETIFHEIGHLVHSLFGNQPYASLNGTNVAWDFVELPSQLMENWTWQEEPLNRIARHFKTGETLPQDLRDRLLSVRNHLVAIAAMRQLSLAKMDLELHLNYNGQTDLDAFIDKALEGYRIPYLQQPPSIVLQFGHLFSDSVGYAAAYYSYKWAEVLDADVFTRFQKEGLFNSDTARDLRKKILEQGNARPADELFFAFMGRKPSLDALLKRDGML